MQKKGSDQSYSMALPANDVLTVIQQSARKRTLLTSCEPEVQENLQQTVAFMSKKCQQMEISEVSRAFHCLNELMHQIDILICTKQAEWEDKLQVLRTQLQCRERDLSSLRVTVQEREAQIEVLKQHNASTQRECKAKSATYEAEVQRLSSEFNRLHRSYEGLKSKRTQSGKRSETTSTQQKDVAASKESSLKSLLKRDESAQSALEECHSLRQQLREAHRNLQWLENQLEEVRVELKRREDLVKGMKAEAATKNRRLQVLQENIRRKDLTIRSLEDQQGLSAFPQHSCIYEDLTQAQTKLSAQLVIEKKLREEIERLKQMNMPIQQECAQLQVQDIMESKADSSMVTSEDALLPEAHGKNGAIEKFVLDVNQLLSSSNLQATAVQTFVTSPEFVPLKPIAGNNAVDLTSGLGGASSSSSSLVQGGTPAEVCEDYENLPRTLEGILDKHIEQIDQSLSRFLKGHTT